MASPKECFLITPNLLNKRDERIESLTINAYVGRLLELEILVYFMKAANQWYKKQKISLLLCDLEKLHDLKACTHNEFF